MFKTRVNRVAIFTPNAAGANENVYEDTTLNQAVVCTDKALNPLIPLLPPIPKNAKNSVQYTASAAEVRQIRIMDIADETSIEAATRYKIMLEQFENEYEKTASVVGEYAYTSPYILTGTLATDRANMVASLVSKMNAHTKNNISAYGVQIVAYNTGNVALPTVGETVVGSVTTFTGVVGKIVTSGAWGGAATGYAYLYNTTGQFATGETLTFSGTGTCVATADGVENQDIIIVDDAGYFRNFRKGATGAYKGQGFADRDTTVLRAHTYEQGNGTNMLADVPRFDESGQKLESGNMDYFTNGEMLPIAGRTYTKVVVNSFRPGIADPMTGAPGVEHETQYLIWVDENTVADVNNFTTILSARILYP